MIKSYEIAGSENRILFFVENWNFKVKAVFDGQNLIISGCFLINDGLFSICVLHIFNSLFMP